MYGVDVSIPVWSFLVFQRLVSNIEIVLKRKFDRVSFLKNEVSFSSFIFFVS